MEAALAVLLLYRTEMPMPDVLVSMPISSFVVVPEKWPQAVHIWHS